MTKEKLLEDINWWRDKAIKTEHEYLKLLEYVRDLVKNDKMSKQDMLELLDVLKGE